MRARLKELSIEIVLDEAYPPNAPDLRPLVLKLKGRAPDVISVTSYTADAIQIYKLIEQMQVDAVAVMAGLTKVEIEEMMALVRRLCQGGITMVMIEHNMHAVMNLSDRVLGRPRLGQRRLLNLTIGISRRHRSSSAPKSRASKLEPNACLGAARLLECRSISSEFHHS
jgi:hypothetical protein